MMSSEAEEPVFAQTADIAGTAATTWQQWCRLCAKEDPQGNTNIFLKDDRMTPDLTLSIAIKKYFAVDICENDQSSKMLCTECLSLINSLVNFSELISKVQAMFAVLQESNSKGGNFSEFRVKYGVQDCERDHSLSHILTEIQCSSGGSSGGDKMLVEDENVQLPAKIKTESIWIDGNNDQDDISESYNHYNEDGLKEIEMEMKNNGNLYDTDELNDDSKNAFASIIEGIKIEPVRLKRKIRKPLRLCDDDGDYDGKSDESHQTKYPCLECGKHFRHLNHFRQHMSKTHKIPYEIPQFSCTECEKSFNTDRQLVNHQKMHLPLSVKQCIPCPFCDRKFTTTHVLQNHINIIHLGERPFICEECGIAVRTNAALKTHLLTHTEERPFQCEICKKGFKNKVRLKVHLETHDNHKHICSTCGLQLNSRATLNRHLLVHSDQKKHKCDYCGREFKRAKALKNHLILHTGLKPYSCNFCERTFANGSNCRSHKKKAHPEELAALEASGSKVFTKNIPKLELLKAVTKVANNLTPVVTKHSGRFAFGVKPTDNPTVAAVRHYRRVVLKVDDPSSFTSNSDQPETSPKEENNVKNENYKKEKLLSQFINKSSPTDETSTISPEANTESSALLTTDAEWEKIF